MKLDAITGADVGRLHRAIGKRRPVVANRVVSAISSAHKFAATEKLVPKGFNPASGIEALRENRRERCLTTAELERLGSALRLAETEGIPWTVDETKPTAKHIPKGERRTRLSPHAVAAIRLLLFTGCRLREVLHLRWEDVDFESAHILLPDSKTGRRYILLNASCRAARSLEHACCLLRTRSRRSGQRGLRHSTPRVGQLRALHGRCSSSLQSGLHFQPPSDQFAKRGGERIGRERSAVVHPQRKRARLAFGRHGGGS